MGMDQPGSGDRARLLRNAVVTLVAVVLAFLALDDITTDRAGSFTAERLALVGCALWFGWLGWRLARQGHPWLGATSFGLAIVWAVTQLSVRPGKAPATVSPEYLLLVASLSWFVVLSGILILLAVAPRRRRAT